MKENKTRNLVFGALIAAILSKQPGTKRTN